MSLDWDAYMELLQLVPRTDAAVLTRAMRDEALRIDEAGPEQGLSRRVVAAVRERLRGMSVQMGSAQGSAA